MSRILAAAAMALCAGQALAQDRWEHEYLAWDGPGTLSTCNFVYFFRNAFIAGRFYADEMDFVYQRDDFALPWDQVLGSALLHTATRSYVLGASTAIRRAEDSQSFTQVMFLVPSHDDFAPLLSSLRNEAEFVIEFPNGAAYSFPLYGSSYAIERAMDCWSTHSTGAYGNNPFGSGAQSGNPFETN